MFVNVESHELADVQGQGDAKIDHVSDDSVSALYGIQSGKAWNIGQPIGFKEPRA